MTSLRTRFFQLALTLVALAGATEALLVLIRPKLLLEHWSQLQVATADAVSRPGLKLEAPTPGMIDLYASSAICLVAVTLMMLLVWRSVQRPEARILAVFLSCLFTPGVVLSTLGVSIGAQVMLQSAGAWLAVACFVRFAALFPRPVTLETIRESDAIKARRKGKEAGASWFRPAFLRPALVWGGAAAGAGFGLAARLTGQVGVDAVSTILMAVWLVAGLGLMRGSYRVADPAGRRQMLWAVQGFYAAAWVSVLAAIPASVISARAGFAYGAGSSKDMVIPYAAVAIQSIAGIVSIGLVVLGLGVALLYDGALDPALALKRTTVYGIVAVSGALLFGIVENVASSVLASALGLSEGMGAAVAGAAVALAFNPLRGWITRAVERRVGAPPAHEPERVEPALA
jgi:hypothetical protein